MELVLVTLGSLPPGRHRALLDMLEAHGLACGGKGAPTELLSLSPSADARPIPMRIPDPDRALLRGQLGVMPDLRVALALGVTAHLALLEACGMPLHRVPFRPGRMITLPDGLILADNPHPLQPRALATLRPLLLRIATVLGRAVPDHPLPGDVPLPAVTA